jgi:hypothetical protein
MAGSPNHLGDGFETENTGGLLSGFLAEEEDLDRRSLWRLGSWGVGAVAAVVVAVLANQSAFRSHLDQIASDDLARQAQQLRTVAKESQNEARRLASAVDTLNGDRDRLYSRVTVLEQGLDSVTGSIARQNATLASPQATVAAPAAPAEPQSTPQNPAAPAVVAPVATTAAATVASTEPTGSNTPAATPATPLMASKSMMAPPDAAAGKLIEPEAPANSVTAAPIPEVVASIPSADTAEPDAAQATAPKLAIQRTEFAVDVGTANSLGGLRALWRGLLQSNAPLAALRPVIAIKEGSNGLGMQLRLVAGPLSDAAAAAKLCASLAEEGQKTCETAVFDGQRLAMRADEPRAPVSKPAPRRRGSKPVASAASPKKPEVPTLSALFSRR